LGGALSSYTRFAENGFEEMEGHGMSNWEASSAGWVVWLRWVLTCTVGWMVSEVVFRAITSAVEGSRSEAAGGLLALAALGAVIGTMQWFVLRQQVYRSGRWVWVSTVGVAVGAVVSQWLDLLDIYIGPGMELDGLLSGAAFGVVVGRVQWLVLRQWVKGAYWWVWASVAGGTMSFFVADVVATTVKVARPGFPVPMVIGTLYGAITGFALVWLLRDPVSAGSNRWRSAA